MTSSFNREEWGEGAPEDDRPHGPFEAAAIIARAKELIADRDFPTEMIVVELARLMALRNFRRGDNGN